MTKPNLNQQNYEKYNKIRYNKRIHLLNKTSEKRNNIGCINSNNNSSCNLSNGNNKVIV